MSFFLKGLIQEAAKDFVSFVNKGPSPFHGKYLAGVEETRAE